MMRICKKLCLAALCFAIAATSAGAAVDTLLYGWGWKNSDREQSPLGCVITDAMRWSAGSDIALFPGVMIRTNLEAGPAKRAELEALFFEPVSVSVVTLDAATLWQLLEEGVSATSMNEDETWNKDASASPDFLQISGFAFEYDLTARYGDRVRVIELADGRTITDPDCDECMTAAVPDAFLREKLPELVSIPTVGTAADALEAYIAQTGILTEPTDTRIRPWGASAEPLAKTYHLGALAVVCSVVVLLFVLRKPREPSWKQLLERPSSKSNTSHKE